MQTNKSFLIIQLNRIGDIIQTFQACRQLKFENPEIKLHLICRNNFGIALDFLLRDTFDNIFYFERDDILSTRTLNSSLENASNFFDKINSFNYSASINLSFCKTSSYLNSLVQSHVKLGLRYNLSGELAIKDSWSQLIYSSVMNSTLTPFNLVDLFRNILGARKINTLTNYNNSNSKFVVIHPFASDAKKRWGATKWAEVIYQLLKNNNGLEIILVGGKNEVNESKRLVGSPILTSFLDRVKNYIGKKNIQEVYEVLKDSRLFIGHDSMVSHLASIAGVKALILSLGSVRPYETSSYGFNKFVLTPVASCYPCNLSDKCEHLKCHNEISHQLVSNISNQLFRSDTFDIKELYENVATFHFENANLYITQLEEETGQTLIPIINKYNKIDNVFLTLYTYMWNLLIANKEVKLAIPDINKITASELSRYLDGINNLYELSNFAIQYTNELLDQAESKNPSTIKIKSISERLIEVDNLTLLSRKPFPLLSPIIDYNFVNKANIDAENIVDVAKMSLLKYHQAANGYAVLYELMQLCVNKYRPKNKDVILND